MYDYWLTMIRTMGNEKKRRLSEYFEGAENVFNAKPKEIAGCPGCDLRDADKIARAKKEINPEEYYGLEKKKIGFVSINMEDYPRPLLDIYDCPYGLFYMGNLKRDFSLSVSIVGARKSSAYGISVAEDLARALALRGAFIISGMARGIDSAAHSGALMEKAYTLAVLGSGVDVCYPESGRRLYESIQERGCIVSEQPPGTKPLPGNFPQRNRIISGLSRVVIVVEAAEKSGSLITADLALEQGKEVYALPGRITDSQSFGCNRLIDQGAGIITSVGDLVERITGEVFLNRREIFLEKEEEVVYSCLDFSPMGLEEIGQKTGIPLSALSDAIISLSRKGLIRREGFHSFVRHGTGKVDILRH